MIYHIQVRFVCDGKHYERTQTADNLGQARAIVSGWAQTGFLFKEDRGTRFLSRYHWIFPRYINGIHIEEDDG